MGLTNSDLDLGPVDPDIVRPALGSGAHLHQQVVLEEGCVLFLFCFSATHATQRRLS